jgi:hypothetical protein
MLEQDFDRLCILSSLDEGCGHFQIQQYRNASISSLTFTSGVDGACRITANKHLKSSYMVCVSV